MNYTIYGAGVNPSENNTSASINIKNNAAQKTAADPVGFQGVIVTAGDALGTKKLDENTYTALLKETDDVREQIMASAKDAKANLKALFNRLSGADAVRIDEDGFNLNEAPAADLVNIVDRIKIELAAHGADYPMSGNGVSLEQIQQVVGSAGYAQSIAGKMQDNGIPLTKDNVSDMAQALEKASGQKKISESAKNYMVQNHMEPTIENIYLAEHAAGSASDAGTDFETGYTSNTAGVLTQSTWQQLAPQVEKMMKQAGMQASENDYNNAKVFIEQGIPVTVENLVFKARLDEIELSGAVVQNAAGEPGPVVDCIIANMAQGGEAVRTPLVPEENIYGQVTRAQETVRNTDYAQVLLATQQADQKQEIVCLKSIEEAAQQLAEQKQNIEPAAAQTGVSEQAKENYRTLMQIQILMTADAGVFLARQGVSLTTVSIAELELKLEAYDRQMYGDAVREAQQGAAFIALQADSAAVLTDSERIYQFAFSVRRALFDIRYSPDVMVGAVLKEQDASEPLTIADCAEMGGRFRERFRQAGQTYEAVGTQKRTDLGDSFTKAVRASTQDILTGLGLENTRANEDAVRILGYNGMEMTLENVGRIKELHASLKSLVRQMSPDKVLNMIRDRVNPMSADIRTLDAYLKNQESDSGDAGKYSTFLYKLDRTQGITEEERTQFIGIYKMMNLFEKDAGAAIGALVKQNADITMENLCMAYSSRKSYGMEVSVDDDADIAAAGAVNYYLNLFDETAYSITPLTLKNVQQRQPIANRSVENFCETAQNTYDAKEEAAYYEDYLKTVRTVLEADQSVVRALENAQQPVTVDNIQAMEQMMQSGFFNMLFGNNKGKVSDFVEKIGQRTELEDMYREWKEMSDRELSEAVSGAEDEAASQQEHYEQFEALRIRNRQIGMIESLSLRHDYSVPFMTEDGVGMLELTLVSDEEQRGRISLHFEKSPFGTVSVEAKVNGSQVSLFGTCQDEEVPFLEKLNRTAEQLQSDFSVKDVRTYCSRTAYVNRITYEEAAESTPTSKLYQMAKTIVQSLL